MLVIRQKDSQRRYKIAVSHLKKELFQLVLTSAQASEKRTISHERYISDTLGTGYEEFCISLLILIQIVALKGTFGLEIVVGLQ